MVPGGRKRKSSAVVDGISYLAISHESLGNKNILAGGLESDLRRNYAVGMSGKTGSLLCDLRVEAKELLEPSKVGHENEFELSRCGELRDNLTA